MPQYNVKVEYTQNGAVKDFGFSINQNGEHGDLAGLLALFPGKKTITKQVAVVGSVTEEATTYDVNDIFLSNEVKGLSGKGIKAWEYKKLSFKSTVDDSQIETALFPLKPFVFDGVDRPDTVSGVTISATKRKTVAPTE